MIKHLLKLTWNKKRAHALVMVEIIASFLVLFGLLSFVIRNWELYRQPLGYNYEQVWALNFRWEEIPDSLVNPMLERIRQTAAGFQEVKHASLASINTPFSYNTMNSTISYEESSTMANQYIVDAAYQEVLEIPLASGRWFDAREATKESNSMVINAQCKEALFGENQAVGKVLNFSDKQYTIVGVIGNFKQDGEYQVAEPAIFINKASTPYPPATLLLKLKPGTGAQFEEILMREIGAMTKGWTLELSHLEDGRQDRNRMTLVPLLIFSIIAIFLLLNVALGLFGMLNLSIARRRDEIGLRRALGASGGEVTQQFMGEMLVIALFSLVVGVLIAIQFPLLQFFNLPWTVYAQAIALAGLLIILLVTLCAYYPSRLAATIQPAQALHDE